MRRMVGSHLRWAGLDLDDAAAVEQGALERGRGFGQRAARSTTSCPPPPGTRCIWRYAIATALRRDAAPSSSRLAAASPTWRDWARNRPDTIDRVFMTRCAISPIRTSLWRMASSKLAARLSRARPRRPSSSLPATVDLARRSPRAVASAVATRRCTGLLMNISPVSHASSTASAVTTPKSTTCRAARASRVAKAELRLRPTPT